MDERRFDGFGIGGALEKESLGAIAGWASWELPEDRVRHFLGIPESDDSSTAVEAGAGAFDYVNPSRVTRNVTIHSPDGRFNPTHAQFRRDFNPFMPGRGYYTYTHYPRAYLHHLCRAKEVPFSTLATTYNEHSIVQPVDRICAVIEVGGHADSRGKTLDRFYAGERGRNTGGKQ